MEENINSNPEKCIVGRGTTFNTPIPGISLGPQRGLEIPWSGASSLRYGAWNVVDSVMSFSFRFDCVAFWLTFINSVRDWVRVREQQDRVFMEHDRLYRKIYSTWNGRCENSAMQSLEKPFAFVRFQRYACVGAIHCALISFTLLLSYALLTIQTLIN
ncbi:hypothetical protein BUALT_Bualt10G0087000 [Buddleja alternifolia]|uniref:Uncharacterized protein n=1 Tax=Buddleja alternifolia TaxID=168488 RepID=A0AAV6X7Y9_9LAMI|nr:hypothetical protein BUALT_Bualt10G0087000 [Buddleja alternifolia]